MRLHAALGLALLLGCSRDLDVPSTSPLSVTPAFASVAPREGLTLAASGGTQGYKFAFANGGKLSGADATLDATTGAYQSGAEGSAQDIIQVSDSSGATVQARITVGQKLFISPSSTLIAPGGKVHFSATGGKPPYVFQLGGTTPGMSIDAQTGLFSAGTGGDVNARVTVVDQTSDSKAQDSALVQVTAAIKLFAPGKDALTPFGTLDLIATGGQPPYVFKLQAGSNSGGSIAAATGHYTAGPSGGPGVQDVVVVSDAFDQTDSVTLSPGPPLSARIDSSDLHPGLPAHILASGGKPPYSFAFATRGNHSNGAIDPITGEYSPGPNFAATDSITVTDSTPGEVVNVTVPGLTKVGPQRWTELRTARRFTADLDGDGHADLLAVTPYPTDPTGLIETRIPRTPQPLVTQYRYAQLLDAAAIDLDGDGHADVAMISPTAFSVVLTNPDGSLGAAQTLAARTWNSGELATLAWAKDGANESFFFADYAASGGACSGPGIARVDWALGTRTAPAAATCAVTVPTGVLTGIVAADLNLDGALDLAFVVGNDNKHLKVCNGPAFTTCTLLSFGSLVFFPEASNETQLFPYAHPGGSGLIALAHAANNSHEVVMQVVANASGATINGPYDPDPSGPGSGGVISLDSAGLFVSFNRLRASLLAFDTTLTAAPSPLAGATFGIDAMAAGDFDGDGAQDVMVGNSTLGLGDIILGDGVGSFGHRPRVTGIPSPLFVTDVDGDGNNDIVTIAGGDALQVVFRDGSEFAYGPLTPISASGSSTLAVGNYASASGAKDALFQQADGSIVLVAGHADGSFDPPITLQQAGGSTTYTLFNTLRPANLGDGKLADALGGFAGQITALLHDPTEPGALIVGPSTPALSGNCFFGNTDLDGNGIADIAAVCPGQSGKPCPGLGCATVQVSLSSGAKDTLAFGAWNTVFTSSSATTAGGTGLLDPNRIAMVTGREIVALSWNGAVVTTVSPLGSWSASTGVKALFCSQLNTDPWSDCAVVDNTGKLHIYLTTAANSFTESASEPSLPAGGVLGLVHANGLGDLLVRPPGNQENFTVLLNAGDGTFP